MQILHSGIEQWLAVASDNAHCNLYTVAGAAHFCASKKAHRVSRLTEDMNMSASTKTPPFYRLQVATARKEARDGRMHGEYRVLFEAD